MGITKEQQEQINEMAELYIEKLKKRVAEGKELKVPGRGRRPTGVSDENMEEYNSLRQQMVELKKLRQASVQKLRDLKEQMDALRSGSKKKKTTKKK